MIGAGVGVPRAEAGFHKKGNVSLSLGGSLAYSANYNRKSKDAVEYEYRNGQVYEREVSGENYSDIDLSLFLSSGYFVRNGLEIGLSGSAMDTWYSSTNRADFGIYDGLLYAKYYFDNSTSLTPYLKAQGGMSWLTNGDYGETDASFGGLGGVEFFGMGSFTWFAELSSLYTVYGGDISGSRWRNQLYLGITWYLNLIEKKGPAVPSAGEALPPEAVDPLAALPPGVREELQKADSRWKKALERIDTDAAAAAQKAAAPQ